MTSESRKTPYFASAEECQAGLYDTPCVYRQTDSQQTPRITPVTAFDCVFRGLIPEGSISELLGKVENQVRKAADARYGAGTGQKLTGGVNNSRGEWLEYILKLIFWNTAVEFNGGKTVIVKLPSAAQLRFRDLYEPRARGYLDELFASLGNLGMDMQMSNPDFLCVTNLVDDIDLPSDPVVVNEDAVKLLDTAYQKLLGRCSADSVPFALAAKTSVRPDRRYQIVHEANVVKSLVAHLGGRFWQQDLYTAFYAMIASKVSEADRNSLRNPATYTLVQVSWTPVPLVDEVYWIDSVEGAQEIVEGLLKGHLGQKASDTTSGTPE